MSPQLLGCCEAKCRLFSLSRSPRQVGCSAGLIFVLFCSAHRLVTPGTESRLQYFLIVRSMDYFL